MSFRVAEAIPTHQMAAADAYQLGSILVSLLGFFRVRRDSDGEAAAFAEFADQKDLAAEEFVEFFDDRTVRFNVFSS